jgi:hypothetical protein
MNNLIAPKFLQSLLCHPQQRRRNEVMLARAMPVAIRHRSCGRSALAGCRQ